MGVLDKFLDAIKLNDDYDDDGFLDDDLLDEEEDDDFSMTISMRNQRRNF